MTCSARDCTAQRSKEISTELKLGFKSLQTPLLSLSSPHCLLPLWAGDTSYIFFNMVLPGKCNLKICLIRRVQSVHVVINYLMTHGNPCCLGQTHLYGFYLVGLIWYNEITSYAYNVVCVFGSHYGLTWTFMFLHCLSFLNQTKWKHMRCRAVYLCSSSSVCLTMPVISAKLFHHSHNQHKRQYFPLS